MTLVLHTSEGDLPILLYYKECPLSSFNFLALCASDYYTDCRFYRHYPGELIQSGDPTNSGKGGESIFNRLPPSTSELSTSSGGNLPFQAPQRYFQDEGFGVTTHSRRGTLSMAHKGTNKDTNASQFFISLKPQPSFDSTYTCFGEILTGFTYVPAQREAKSADPDEEKLTNIGNILPPEKVTPGLGLHTGEQVLRSLEISATEIDEKSFVLNEDIKINGATILFNPFAEGKMKL